MPFYFSPLVAWPCACAICGRPIDLNRFERGSVTCSAACRYRLLRHRHVLARELALQKAATAV